MRHPLIVLLGAIALVCARASSQTARADSKGDFQKGCEDGGGT
jgi:hypothetical protein